MKNTTKEIEGYSLPYVLWLDNSDRIKNSHWLLQFMTKENGPGLDLADEFKQECYEIPKSLNWFHQGGVLPGNRRSAWHMFEFWSDKEEEILEACLAIAKELGLELQLEQFSRADLDYINR